MRERLNFGSRHAYNNVEKLGQKAAGSGAMYSSTGTGVVWHAAGAGAISSTTGTDAVHTIGVSAKHPTSVLYRYCVQRWCRRHVLVHRRRSSGLHFGKGNDLLHNRLLVLRTHLTQVKHTPPRVQRPMEAIAQCLCPSAQKHHKILPSPARSTTEESK